MNFVLHVVLNILQSVTSLGKWFKVAGYSRVSTCVRPVVPASAGDDIRHVSWREDNTGSRPPGPSQKVCAGANNGATDETISCILVLTLTVMSCNCSPSRSSWIYDAALHQFQFHQWVTTITRNLKFFTRDPEKLPQTWLWFSWLPDKEICHFQK